MHYPEISGLVSVTSGKYGSVALRYRVDTTANAVTFIIKQSRVDDLLYSDYAAARAQYDEICECCGYARRGE